MGDKIMVCMAAPVPPPYGGIANWYDLITKYADREKLPVEFITLNIAPKKRSTEGRTIFDRIFVSGVDMLKKKRELRGIVKNSRPDVIHMTTSGQLAIIRDILLLRYAKKKKIPTVYHIRFGRISEIAEKNTFEWKLMKKAVGYAGTTIAIDKRTEKTLSEKCGSSNIVYIPNPFDGGSVNAPIRAWEDRKKQLVFVGWLVKTKGVEELLGAWDELSREFGNHRLVVIGPGKDEYTAELKEKFRCENVEFTGELGHEEALNRVAESSMLVLPSYTEGFPNVVLEAMALKVPTVATNVGAIPEMLADDSGIIIEPRSEEQLADAVRSMLSDESKAAAYSENAYRRLKNEYSVEIIMREYIDLWNSLILSKNKEKSENDKQSL